MSVLGREKLLLENGEDGRNRGVTIGMGRIKKIQTCLWFGW